MGRNGGLHFCMSKKKREKEYPNGGDDMFFYHKKIKHPAKQLSHTDETWTNKRYTHHPNRPGCFEEDAELSTENEPVYRTKKAYVDSIYTRGNPYKMKKKR